jgi:hypothetical protein
MGLSHLVIPLPTKTSIVSTGCLTNITATNDCSYLAELGAIITIMAAFTGFFSRQLVQFRDCLQQDTAALVNISRTNAYDKTGGSTEGNVPAEFVPMSAVINVGILQSAGDLTNLLSAGCSSGNCNFSDTESASFSTLAISHFCTNVTSRIRIVSQTQQNASAGYSEEFTGAYL